MKQTPKTSTTTIQALSPDQTQQGRFLVSGALSFETVPDLMKQALRLFAPFDSIIVDFSAVENCNSVGLAVVLEIAKEMQRQNKSVCFQSLPEQIHTFARAYSVDEELSQAGLLC